MRKPDFFIVGAPKCGTTAMQHYLSQHPDIFLPDRDREMHFFGSDLRFTRPRCTIERYRAHFDAPEAKFRRRVGEKSVFYLYSKRAASEIRDFAGAGDIIIMLRNPVDMLYSLHSHMLRSGGEEIEDFKAALKDESIRKQARIPQELIISGLFYLQVGKYTDQVKRYFDRFGRENVHIIIYDDLKQDAASVYRKTLCFLSIDDRFQPRFEVVNPNKQVRSKTFRSLLWTLKSNHLARSLARATVPRPLRHEVHQTLMWLTTRTVSRPAMDPELRVELQRKFHPEVQRLSELLGRDLTHWCR